MVDNTVGLQALVGVQALAVLAMAGEATFLELVQAVFAVASGGFGSFTGSPALSSGSRSSLDQLLDPVVHPL